MKYNFDEIKGQGYERPVSSEFGDDIVSSCKLETPIPCSLFYPKSVAG